ncbi:hypothetical protein BGX34_010632, partial [Mortierella sp. NVP85]
RVQPRRQDRIYPWLNPTGPGGVAPDAVATAGGTIPASSEGQATRESASTRKCKSSSDRNDPKKVAYHHQRQEGLEAKTPSHLLRQVEAQRTKKREREEVTAQAFGEAGRAVLLTQYNDL